MKHLRALQEQASTYLDLVCSVCDLSDETVRETATKIQQTKTMVTAKESLQRFHVSIIRETFMINVLICTD